ncbi:MAG TPA: hypothetical protein VEC12_02165 [Bacteroidia bacterium]|nr:hypothetical protein [Bacteroidia bacterium]
MNQRLAILFASFCILVFFGSCQKRYGHVKKVKKSEKISFQRKHPTHKNKQQEYFSLQNKKPALSASPFTDSFLVDITPARSHQHSLHNKKLHRQLKPTVTKAASDTPDNFYAPHPELEDVKLDNSNFSEVANVSLIVGLVLILILLLFLLGSFAVAGIAAGGFLAAAAAEEIFLAALGLALVYPIIWLINRLYKDLRDDKMEYGDEEYPLKDLKHMPGQIQLKRAWHNFIASILLTGLFSLLFLFGIIFLPGVIWYFLKLIHALFFIERY